MNGNIYLKVIRIIKSDTVLDPSDHLKAAKIMDHVIKNPFDSRAFDLFVNSLRSKYGEKSDEFIKSIDEIKESLELQATNAASTV